MALTDLERLRLLIADRPRVILQEIIGTGDGSETLFLLQMAPVVAESETITVNGTVQTRDTDYTLDNGVGLVTFTAAPAAGAELKATYRWTTFSDEELQDLLDQGLSVTRAAIQAIEWLLADTDRFIKYTFGQESVDRTSAREGLEHLLAGLRQQLSGPVTLVKADDRVPAGTNGTIPGTGRGLWVTDV